MPQGGVLKHIKTPHQPVELVAFQSQLNRVDNPGELKGRQTFQVAELVQGSSGRITVTTGGCNKQPAIARICGVCVLVYIYIYLIIYI